jgi:predicted dehydrogenase
MHGDRSTETGSFTRRDFVRASAGLAAAAMTVGLPLRAGAARSGNRLRIGVIGCGGRGTGAASNALESSPDVEIVALADVLPDHLDLCRKDLSELDGGRAERAKVSPERCHSGFDAYKALLASDVDLVILATPPHFRHIHLAAAVAAGKHVFMEKPVAVDGPGIRSVLESAQAAADKRLCIVAGTQRRHEKSYLESMARLRDGAIGTIVAARCYWTQGGLWMHERQPAWSDMEWQLRNWLYFTWLSGDHIVEQHVHNLDVVNWAIGAHPLRASGMGGRQVRTSPAYGHVFDHFAVEYEYPGGVTVQSMCRQIDGCSSRVEEVVVGTLGTCRTRPGSGRIEGPSAWRFKGENPNPYVQEHVDLLAAIASGTPVNEAKQVAESTLTAIMGRMSAYTGKDVTWEQALNSKESLSPESYTMGPLPVPPVAVPGRTPLL